jgi:hypothetical protein
MITAIMSWFIPKRWYFIGAFYALSLVGVFLWTWNWRDDVCETKALVQTVQTMEKRNEIASKRPDKSGVIKQLRSGAF